MEWRTCVVLLFVTVVLADEQWLIVETEQGPVRGRRHSSGQLFEFYNVPYASAPVGVNKFKAPRPPPKRSETFDATDEVSTICPQNDIITMFFQDRTVVKEDCLVANIFVPDTTERNLSVLVFVHGGGFVTGFGNFDRGTQLVREKKDFIMITFNYRLGIHGFLCLGTEDAPGNAGMKDQVALLRWVQKNIASFGGNPNDVTLGGSSAGSASVDLIMLSKSAKGLFQRVIPESAGNLAVFSIQRDPLEIAKTHARNLDFADADDIDALGNFYKSASMDLLTADAFFNRTDSTFMFSPCVERDTEDAFLTESPLSILKKGDYVKLPMLYGFANMEGLLRIPYFELWKQKMNANFSDFLPADLKFESDAEREEVVNKIKKFYFNDNPVSNENVLKYVDFFSDVMFTHPKLWAVKLHAEAGHNQVYLYEYSFVDEDTPPVIHTDVRGATHCAQSTAWLDNMGDGNESLATPEYQKMRKVVREMWHNFIKTGMPVPAGSSLPAWPAAGANRSPHMELNEPLVLRGALLEERTRFWEEIYEKHYLEAVPPRSGAGRLTPKTMFSLFALYILYYFIRTGVVE